MKLGEVLDEVGIVVIFVAWLYREYKITEARNRIDEMIKINAALADHNWGLIKQSRQLEDEIEALKAELGDSAT